MWARPDFRGALAATAVVFPLVGTIVSSIGFFYFLGINVLGGAFDFLAGPENSYLANFPMAVLVGLVAAGIAWSIVAKAYQQRTTASAANARSYRDLIPRLDAAQAFLDNLEHHQAGAQAGQGQDEDETKFARRLAVDEACRHIASIRHTIGADGVSGGVSAHPAWVSGEGYLAVWSFMHRAEEALLKVRPLAELRANIEMDRLRLTGSAIENRDDLLAQLAAARAAIVASQGAPAPASAPLDATPQLSLSEARETVVQVRRAINSFSANRWASLVQLRNVLHGGGILCAFISFALFLGVTSLGQTDDGYAAAPLTACILFVVGALGGTFLTLYNDMQREDGAVDEFNVLAAKLTLTPVVAGLAAIAAVFVIGSLIPVTLSPASPQQVAREAMLAAEKPNDLPPGPARDIFNFSRNPLGLLIALLAGMFPELFMRRLWGLTDRIMSQLDLISPISGRLAGGATASSPPSGPG